VRARARATPPSCPNSRVAPAGGRAGALHHVVAWKDVDISLRLARDNRLKTGCDSSHAQRLGCGGQLRCVESLADKLALCTRAGPLPGPVTCTRAGPLPGPVTCLALSLSFLSSSLSVCLPLSLSLSLSLWLPVSCVFLCPEFLSARTTCAPLRVPLSNLPFFALRRTRDK
jgi:hypothetical protein